MNAEVTKPDEMWKLPLEEQPVEYIIQYVKENFIFRDDAPYYMAYIKALKEGDEKVLQEFRSFGHTIRHAVENRRRHDAYAKFGFDIREIKAYGWLDRNIKWLDYEKYELNDRNYIKLGRGPNGLWAWGYSYDVALSGGGCSINEFRDPIESREKTILAGLTFLMGQYSKCYLDEKKRSEPTKSVLLSAGKMVSLCKEALYLSQCEQLTLF